MCHVDLVHRDTPDFSRRCPLLGKPPPQRHTPSPRSIFSASPAVCGFCEIFFFHPLSLQHPPPPLPSSSSLSANAHSCPPRSDPAGSAAAAASLSRPRGHSLVVKGGGGKGCWKIGGGVEGRRGCARRLLSPLGPTLERKISRLTAASALKMYTRGKKKVCACVVSAFHPDPTFTLHHHHPLLPSQRMCDGCLAVHKQANKQTNKQKLAGAALFTPAVSVAPPALRSGEISVPVFGREAAAYAEWRGINSCVIERPAV